MHLDGSFEGRVARLGRGRIVLDRHENVLPVESQLVDARGHYPKRSEVMPQPPKINVESPLMSGAGSGYPNTYDSPDSPAASPTQRGYTGYRGPPPPTLTFEAPTHDDHQQQYQHQNQNPQYHQHQYDERHFEQQAQYAQQYEHEDAYGHYSREPVRYITNTNPYDGVAAPQPRVAHAMPTSTYPGAAMDDTPSPDYHPDAAQYNSYPSSARSSPAYRDDRRHHGQQQQQHPPEWHGGGYAL